jgi:hypothetical protein
MTVLMALLVAAGGCHGAKSRVGAESLKPKTPSKNAEPAAGQVIDLAPGDRAQLELTVFHPPFIYLTGKSPVTVYPPTTVGWRFAKREYDLERPFFPMIIPFEITNDVAIGPYKLRLAVRLEYAFKADDKPLSTNVMIETPFRVIPGVGVRRERIIRAPIEYTLEVTSPIEQVEIK